MARKLTTRDVCEVSGYSKEEFRALSDAIGLHKHQHVQPRVAREYTRHDLIVITVIRELETTFGMRRSAISEIYKPLRTALSGPKPINRKARVLVTVSPPTVTYLDAVADVSDGILFGLQTVFDRVDAHFGAYVESAPAQEDLKLSPTVIRHRNKNTGGGR